MNTIKALVQDAIYNSDLLWRPPFEYAGEVYLSGAPRWYWLWVHVMQPVLAWCDSE